MSSVQEKTVDLPSPGAIAIAMVPDEAAEQAQRIDHARAEVAAVLRELYGALSRLLNVRKLLHVPPQRERFYFEEVENLHRFKPGSDWISENESNIEAEYLIDLEFAAGIQLGNGSADGILQAIETTQRILKIDHFSMRKSMARQIEGLQPEVYREIAEAAARGEWLKGATL